MSDLINRKVLLEDFRKTITEQSDTLDWLNLINNQPIAYDVDKVLKKLNELWEAYHNRNFKNGYGQCLHDLNELVKVGGKN